MEYSLDSINKGLGLFGKQQRLRQETSRKLNTPVFNKASLYNFKYPKIETFTYNEFDEIQEYILSILKKYDCRGFCKIYTEQSQFNIELNCRSEKYNWIKIYIPIYNKRFTGFKFATQIKIFLNDKLFSGRHTPFQNMSFEIKTAFTGKILNEKSFECLLKFIIMVTTTPAFKKFIDYFYDNIFSYLNYLGKKYDGIYNIPYIESCQIFVCLLISKFPGYFKKYKNTEISVGNQDRIKECYLKNWYYLFK